MQDEHSKTSDPAVGSTRLLSERIKTNRQAHEEAAGMGLCDEFFSVSGIDPDALYSDNEKGQR